MHKTDCSTGVFGGLDMHGTVRHVAWTHLATTAAAGADSVTVAAQPDWGPGDEVAIAPSSFSCLQTEVRTVTEVQLVNNLTTLSLNETLHFDHVGMQ